MWLNDKKIIWISFIRIIRSHQINIIFFTLSRIQLTHPLSLSLIFDATQKYIISIGFWIGTVRSFLPTFSENYIQSTKLCVEFTFFFLNLHPSIFPPQQKKIDCLCSMSHNTHTAFIKYKSLSQTVFSICQRWFHKVTWCEGNQPFRAFFVSFFFFIFCLCVKPMDLFCWNCT